MTGAVAVLDVGKTNVKLALFAPDGAMVFSLTAIGASESLDTSDEGKVLAGMRRCADVLTQRLRGAPAQVQP